MAILFGTHFFAVVKQKIKSASFKFQWTKYFFCNDVNIL